jgi:hypothetical protein
MAKFKFKKVAKLDDVPEAYRGLYVEKDGSFVVDPAKLEDFEWDDKEELRTALEAERKERKQAKADLEKYKGIDPDKARAAQAKLDELDEKQLIDKGEFERLNKKRETERETERAAWEKEKETYVSQLTKFKLTDKVRAAALAAGVIPEDIDDVLTITSNRFRLGEKDQIVILDKDGDESSLTLDKYFGEEFKAQKPKFYAASGAGGSGASAGTSGGTGNSKTMKRADFEKLPPVEQRAFLLTDKGALTD